MFMSYLVLLVSRDNTQECMHANTRLRLQGICLKCQHAIPMRKITHWFSLAWERRRRRKWVKDASCASSSSFFFTYCWSIFPSLLYPACPSVAQKSKKSKLLASTPVYLAISPPNLQYLSIFSPCPSSRLCSLFASDFYQSIYPLSIQRAPVLLF